MKKTISLSLVFSFLMALTIQMPALATDTPTSTPSIPPELTSSSTPLTSTSTPTIEPVSPAPAEGLAPELISTSTEPIKIDTSTLGKRLEKIAHPDQIKLFEKITQIGNALYGVRKSTSTPATSQIMKPATTSTSTQGLEKIASPDQIKLYEKIKQVGTVLYGIKKKIAAVIENIKQEIKNVPVVLPTLTSDLITCAGTAIDTKDGKISAAITSSASDITTAITARGTCQKSALALSSEQNAAINKCNQDFQTATKAANEKVKSTQKDIWTTYTSDLKTCASTAKSTELKIEDGGQNTTDTLSQ